MPCKILLVDSEASNISALSEFLDDDFELFIWQQDQNVLQLSETILPDIVIIDMSLETLDGLSICQSIKRNHNYNHTRVVLLSPNNLIDDKLQGYTVGADDFLVKPIDHAELLMKMKVYSKLIDAEKQILQLNESLKQQVETQTKKLIQSEKMASIGQLAAGVAHEINNPMCFITTNLEAMAEYMADFKAYTQSISQAVDEIVDLPTRAQLQHTEQALQEKYQFNEILQDVDNIVTESLDGANRVTTIVKDLKTFARCDDRFESVDLNDTIENTLNLLHNQLKSKIKVEKKFTDDLFVLGIHNQLSQVMMNLIINACHAIDESGTISISTQKQNDHCIICIRDDGCGIAPTTLGLIFDPFYTTKPVGVGTGLGLSISYAIIERHNGHISVKSEVNQGTTFTISLPRIESSSYGSKYS